MHVCACVCVCVCVCVRAHARTCMLLYYTIKVPIIWEHTRHTVSLSERRYLHHVYIQCR